MKSRGRNHAIAFVAAAAVGLVGSAHVQAQALARANGARTSVHATNVTVNRNVNVYHQDVHYDRWGHPLAAAAAVTAIGTVVSALPARCSAVVLGAVTYQSCGGVYYQPVYQGSGVQYVVVNAPR
jgi:hypothetical protein